LSSYNQTSCVD